ncbi:hypothetical protein ESZ54_10990 [Vagococcus silagei]|uniref:Uncharacterized protein n=2 Tax=Vagococcus silagei TaxID=2508885 RepID=A0A4S3B6S8_9ENTE|nr:hypothetical protein ESZ54_10990 [Vagococcus silagei]
MNSGKSIASGIAKMVPGVGTSGSLISVEVGMVITGALGYAYIELMEGQVDLSSTAPEALTVLLVGLLSNFLPNGQ